MPHARSGPEQISQHIEIAVIIILLFLLVALLAFSLGLPILTKFKLKSDSS